LEAKLDAGFHALLLKEHLAIFAGFPHPTILLKSISQNFATFSQTGTLITSVVDTDTDPRIHASDKWIRIRIWILNTDPAIFVIDLQDAKKTNFL
jgi:hypothetical protein